VTDVVICGGGIVGLGIAWRAASAGLDVCVVDPAPGGGASAAAAGLLSPVFEARPREERLLALNLASYERWPAFASELTEVTGIDLQLRQQGTIGVALDGDDLRALDDLCRFHEGLDLPVARLRGGECRELEPMLSTRIRGGVRVETESSVDPRAVCAALLSAGDQLGVWFVRQRIVEVRVANGRVDGVAVADGSMVSAPRVVVSLGAWSAHGSLPREATPPVRPVKGQILRLRFDPATPPLTRNIHVLARGREIYVVPRRSGELVVGATVEERGFDVTVTAGGVRDLLDTAIEVLPIVAELEQVEAMARSRPASIDNAPVLGATPIDGLVLATGHYRNGVLLTPITADAITTLIVDGKTPPEIEWFTLERFG
jgi:glycine oxidase